MRADLDLTQLMVDPENPRMEIQTNSREALRELFRSDRAGMLELARDISERGRISPLEKIGVFESMKHRKRYIVAEGNRRIAALIALNTPDVLKGAISSSAMTRLRTLSRDFLKKNPPDLVECEILPKQELHQWMALRHTAAGPRGLLRWGSKEQQRFLERTGSRKSIEMQFLDFYSDFTRGNIYEAERAASVPLSTFRRLLDSTDVRNRLGIDVSAEGVALSAFPADETFKWLRKVVHDLAGKVRTSRNLNTTVHMLQYLETFSEHELPNEETALREPVPIEPLAKAPETSTSKRVRTPARRSWSLRQLKLRPIKPRLTEIVEELEQVSIDRAPNIHGILLRVLVELATDDYLKHRDITVSGSKSAEPTLKEKVNAAAKDLASRNKLSNSELTVVQKMTANERLYSTHTLHQFVHNDSLHPSPRDVEAMWKNLGTYLVKMQER